MTQLRTGETDVNTAVLVNAMKQTYKTRSHDMHHVRTISYTSGKKASTAGLHSHGCMMDVSPETGDGFNSFGSANANLVVRMPIRQQVEHLSDRR
jgi:hypothetical protein